MIQLIEKANIIIGRRDTLIRLMDKIEDESVRIALIEAADCMTMRADTIRGIAIQLASDGMNTAEILEELSK